MGILTNKHFVVALIVTPILAVLGYFAVDIFVAEQPHLAKSGTNYELIEQSNCRYNSGQCKLKNGNFELHLKTDWLPQNKVMLHIESLHPLNGVKVASLSATGKEGQPLDMKPVDNDGKHWQAEMLAIAPGEDRLRLVASAKDSLYYADASTTFSIYETGFEQDFRN